MTLECIRNAEVMYRTEHFSHTSVSKYIIIIIIIIIFVITFMQGFYYCVPETNHVSRVHNVAAVLYLQVCYI